MQWEADEEVMWAPHIQRCSTTSTTAAANRSDACDPDVEASLPRPSTALVEVFQDDLTPGPPVNQLLIKDRKQHHHGRGSCAHVDPHRDEDVDDDAQVDDMQRGGEGAFVDTGKEFLATKAFLGAIYPPTAFRRTNEDGTPKDPFDNMDEKFNNWEAPEVTLDLDYVMGYRARNSRYNIHWISEDECVFPAAGVGVIYNNKINDESFFFGHEDDIVSLDLHHADPNNPDDVDLVVSGSLGARNNCQLCIWEAKEPRRMRHNITGFLQFGVMTVSFNPDASLVVASGFDEHHTVALFSVVTGQLLGHCAADKNRLLHVRFNLSAVVNSNEEFVSVGDRHLCFWKPMGTAGKGSNYYLKTEEPLDRRIFWSRGTGIDDIDRIALTSVDFSYAHTIVGGSDGIIYLIDSIRHSLSIRIAVNTAQATNIYAILTLRNPGENSNNSFHDVVSVGTGIGLISFWDVNTDPDTKDVKISENKTTTGDGSRINLNKFDDRTNSEGQTLVNSVRSMSWYGPTKSLAVGTILTTVYDIDVDKWTAKFTPKNLKTDTGCCEHPGRGRGRGRGGHRSNDPADKDIVARVMVTGHYVGGKLTDETTGEVWGVDVHPSRQIAATCGDDLTVRLWDLEASKQLAIAYVERQSLMVSFHPAGKVIAVGHRRGGFTVLSGDLRYVVIPFQKANQTRSVTDIAFSPNGKLLAVGWGQKIDVYNFIREKDPVLGYSTCKTELVGVCMGHTSFVDNFDWNLESTLLQSISRGYDLIYHSIPDCVMVTGVKAIADELWFTQTCTIGWGVQGIWPRYADGTDINSTAKSRSQRYVATTDDWGRVKLFNYPCLGSGFDRKTGRLNRRPAFHEYMGHSSHVTNSAWTFDDKYLITTGGADLSVFVWRVVYDAIPEEKRPKFFLNAASVGFVQHGRRGLVAKKPTEDEESEDSEEGEGGQGRPGTGESGAQGEGSMRPGSRMRGGRGRGRGGFSGGWASMSVEAVSRSDGECFMCKYAYKEEERAATFCPRCNAPRNNVAKEKWRKAWQGEASSRFTQPTQSFAKYTREQQAMRKQTEERPKPEVHWKSGTLKVVETVHGASSDEDEIEKKLQGKKRAIKAAAAAEAQSATSASDKTAPKAKKTSGPDFRDY